MCAQIALYHQLDIMAQYLAAYRYIVQDNTKLKSIATLKALTAMGLQVSLMWIVIVSSLSCYCTILCNELDNRIEQLLCWMLSQPRAKEANS